MNLSISYFLYLLRFVLLRTVAALHTRFGLLSSEKAQKEAVKRVQSGQAVAVDVGGVWYLIGDSANQNFIAEAIRMLGVEAVNKRLMFLTSYSAFLLYIRMDLLEPEIAKLISKEDFLVERFGGFVALEAPVNKTMLETKNLPASLVQTTGHDLQVTCFDPRGSTYLYKLYEKLNKSGILFPSIVMFTPKDTPALNSARGQIFASVCSVYGLLHSGFRSYTAPFAVLRADKFGFSVQEKGGFPAALLQALVPEKTIDFLGSSPVIFKAESVSYGFGPKLLRQAILQQIGRSKKKIIKKNKVSQF